jgi:hypothetical protein
MQRPIHPLTGADPATLVRLVRASGWPQPRHLPTLAAAGGAALGRAPLSAAEAAWDALRGSRRDTRPPVFIVGHWRSGTTHLFNLLSGGGGVAYATPIAVGLPWDFELLGRLAIPLLRRAIPSGRGIDEMAVTPESPQEDELALASMTAPSFYHGVYFPRRFAEEMARGLFFDGCSAAERERWQRALRRFTQKVERQAPAGGRVLVKNPAHTARIDAIREIWPDARFIHIVRDPHAVLQSSRRMFADLLDMLALQKHDPEVLERTLLATYPRMMDKLIADSRDLPPERFAEVRFEDLEAAPLATVRALAEQIGLAPVDAVVAAAERHLAAVADYRKRTREIPQEVAETVARHWGRQLDHWTYPRRAGVGAETEA